MNQRPDQAWATRADPGTDRRVPPVVWSLAGNDTAGGAGLAADLRAAEACGVHLCPVVAAITAQNSLAVTRVEAVPTDLLMAQLEALAEDLPPRVIKTGLLGSVDNVRAVAHFVDRLRVQAPVHLVVDPVLRASTGATLADEALRAAYLEHLLPRTTLLTPNRAEAQALLAASGAPTPAGAPELAAALRTLGAQAVVVTGGDDAARHPWLSLDWMDSPQTRGWLSLPRLATPHTHGTGCTFASSAAAAMARGFVVADAVVLAKMATTAALRQGRTAGRGAGPVLPRADFVTDPTLLPTLSLDEDVPNDPPCDTAPARSSGRPPLGVYAIVDSAERAEAVLAARPSVSMLQLRIKRPPQVPPDDPAWCASLRAACARAQAAADAAGAALVLNDHLELALELGARALHLGQDDLLALDGALRARLARARRAGLQLGLSSHSLWELCRAAGLRPDLIACGPVWATTTKDMPWHPQGLDNLAWWVRMAPAPVVGIGGILQPAQLRAVAATGAAGACVVRGLGEAPAQTLPGWLEAWRQGRAEHASTTVDPGAWPHPTLDGP